MGIFRKTEKADLPSPYRPVSPLPVPNPFSEAMYPGGSIPELSGEGYRAYCSNERILTIRPSPFYHESRGSLPCDECPARTGRVFVRPIVTALFMASPRVAVFVPEKTRIDCCGLTSTAQIDVRRLLRQTITYLWHVGDSPPWCPIQFQKHMQRQDAVAPPQLPQRMTNSRYVLARLKKALG